MNCLEKYQGFFERRSVLNLVEKFGQLASKSGKLASRVLKFSTSFGGSLFCIFVAPSSLKVCQKLVVSLRYYLGTGVHLIIMDLQTKKVVCPDALRYLPFDPKLYSFPYDQANLSNL